MAEPKTTANTPPESLPESTFNVTSQEKFTHKIRISLPPLAGTIFYNDENNDLLRPLALTKGFLFPIQPAVTMGYDAKYQELSPTHSNFSYQMYQSSSIKPISFTGDFLVRNQYDAQYVNAGIHFLKSLTRMFNYNDGEYAGAPPHVVRLHGMGFTAFDNIPCVLTDVTINYPESVDHITFQINKKVFGSETARIPVFLTITVSLTPVFSRDFITNVYNTTGFSKGKIRALGPKVDQKVTDVDQPVDQSEIEALNTTITNTLIKNALTGATKLNIDGTNGLKPSVNIVNSSLAKVGSIVKKLPGSLPLVGTNIPNTLSSVTQTAVGSLVSLAGQQPGVAKKLASGVNVVGKFIR